MNPLCSEQNQDNQDWYIQPQRSQRYAEKDLSFSPSARLCVLRGWRGWTICTNVTWSDLESIRKVINLYVLLRKIGLVCALFFASPTVHAQDGDWPQFRGPNSNPVGAHTRLAERWSKTENVEWSQEIPGRGWSSPIVTGGRVYVTTVTTEGKSKPPQIGTEYSNEYAAELLKQGLPMEQVLERVTERDIELPKEVMLHYFLYCLNLKSGKVEWQKEFYTGRPSGGRHRKNSFASESPVTDGKFVYVYVANLGLWAFDVKGKQVWTTPLEANPIYLDFGTGRSPALAGNLLVIGRASRSSSTSRRATSKRASRPGAQIETSAARGNQRSGPAGRLLLFGGTRCAPRSWRWDRERS